MDTASISVGQDDTGHKYQYWPLWLALIQCSQLNRPVLGWAVIFDAQGHAQVGGAPAFRAPWKVSLPTCGGFFQWTLLFGPLVSRDR